MRPRAHNRVQDMPLAVLASVGFQAGRRAAGGESAGEVGDTFGGVEAMEVDEEFVGVGVVEGVEVRVSLVVERGGGDAVRGFHEVVFGLPAEGEGAGGADVVAVPGLCGAGER